MDNKRLEAEAKLWANKLGAQSLGGSWMKVLTNEFKKDYFTKVTFIHHPLETIACMR